MTLDWGFHGRDVDVDLIERKRPPHSADLQGFDNLQTYNPTLIQEYLESSS